MLYLFKCIPQNIHDLPSELHGQFVIFVDDRLAAIPNPLHSLCECVKYGHNQPFPKI